MELLKPLKSAALSIGAVALLLGCGSVSSTSVDRAPSEEANDDTQRADQRSALANWYGQWSGTAEDFQAAHVLRAHALNGAYGDCVASAGLDYDWFVSVLLQPSLVDDGTWSHVWAFPIMAPVLSTDALAQAHNAAMELRMNNVPLTAAENEVGLRCRSENPEAPEGEVDSITNPEGLEDLRRDWMDAVSSALNDFPNEATYMECLADTGLPGGTATDPQASFERFQEYMTGLTPDFRTLSSESRRAQSEEWQSFLDAEERYLVADQECRGELAERALPIVASLTGEFEERRQESVARLQSYWMDVRARASRLGWSPEEPLGPRSPELLSEPLADVDERN